MWRFPWHNEKNKTKFWVVNICILSSTNVRYKNLFDNNPWSNFMSDLYMIPGGLPPARWCFSVWPVQSYLLNVLQEGDQVTCWWQQTRVHVTPDWLQGFSEEPALNHCTNATYICFHHLKETKGTNGVGEERKTDRQRDRWLKEEKKSKGKRVMEVGSEQTSKVRRGRFWLSVIGLQHMDSGDAEWKYKSNSNTSLLEIHMGKIKTGQWRVSLIGLPIKTLSSVDGGGYVRDRSMMCPCSGHHLSPQCMT